MLIVLFYFICDRICGLFAFNLTISEKLSHKIVLAYALLRFFFDFLTTKVSHGSVATQLCCGGLFNKHMTATCQQSLPVKKIENRLIFREDMDNHKVGRFFETQ